MKEITNKKDCCSLLPRTFMLMYSAVTTSRSFQPRFIIVLVIIVLLLEMCACPSVINTSSQSLFCGSLALLRVGLCVVISVVSVRYFYLSQSAVSSKLYRKVRFIITRYHNTFKLGPPDRPSCNHG